MDFSQILSLADQVGISALRMAHLAADHRLAAGDTSDLLPGVNAEKAVESSRRIIASDYHVGCPLCEGR